MRFGRHLQYHTLGKHFQVSRKLEISTTHVQNGHFTPIRFATGGAQSLLVCNRVGRGKKAKEGNATAQSDESNHDEGGSEKIV